MELARWPKATDIQVNHYNHWPFKVQSLLISDSNFFAALTSLAETNKRQQETQSSAQPRKCTFFPTIPRLCLYSMDPF